MNLYVLLIVSVVIIFVIGLVSSKFGIGKKVQNAPDFLKTIMVNISMTVCIALLFFNLPYSYFEFVRFMVLIGGIFNALVYTRYQRTASVLLSSIMVIMFNPLIPFSFDRSEWLKLDVLVLCALAVLTSLDFKELRVENKSDV